MRSHSIRRQVGAAAEFNRLQLEGPGVKRGGRGSDAAKSCDKLFDRAGAESILDRDVCTRPMWG